MRKRLRAEDGVAMGVALAALSILLVISAVTFASSMNLSQTSNNDRNDKRAFAAAEAGLQVATYRLNNLAPLDSQCVANVVQLPVLGGCTGTGQLDDGASWSYYMTPVLSNGNCAGFPISYDPSSGAATLAPRCVTATGNVNGATKRVQARVVMFKGNPLYPLNGIVGLQGVTVSNSASITGALGSNGLVSVGNSSEISNGIELGPGAPSPTVGNSGASVDYRSPEDGGWVFAPVEIGNTATENDNGNWSVTGNPNATFTWNATARELTVTKGTLTLLGGTYNFCRITIGSNATIGVANAAKARVFIDSPERGSASGCAAGTGYVDASNHFTNPGSAENLQLYVYGSDPSPTQAAVTFNNAATLNMGIHAPRSTVLFKNHASITGAVNANRFEVKNSLDFTWAATMGTVRSLNNVLMYERTGWRECRRKATTSDPGSGC